jgi:hypothetical protein
LGELLVRFGLAVSVGGEAKTRGHRHGGCGGWQGQGHRPHPQSRGAPAPEAVRHLIFAQAASVISAADSATSQPANDVARGLARYGASLTRR